MRLYGSVWSCVMIHRIYIMELLICLTIFNFFELYSNSHFTLQNWEFIGFLNLQVYILATKSFLKFIYMTDVLLL